MKNLKYRVYSVSSQNPQLPAGNLQDGCAQWQSQHNCTYPQQLTVQFFVPIQTKNMKILFHQYKIPKLIQVFVRCGKQQKYRKLGLIEPSDNSQSDYLQKQIKTVLFEFPCSFVKLVFHQNYRNQMNLFDQIALCELSFEGQILPTSQYKNLDINILDSLDTSSDEQSTQNQQKQLPTVQIQKKTSQNFSSVLFPEVFEKLEHAKQEAVSRQQFQKAQYIKNSINNFQQMQKQILKLQELKKLALEQEDYDRCHKLKIQIGRKKQATVYQIKQFESQMLQNNVLSFSRANQLQQNRSNFNTNRESRLQTEQRALRTPVINRNVSPQPNDQFFNNNNNNKNNNNNFNNNVNNNISSNEYDSQVVPALRKKKNAEEQYLNAGKVNQSIMDPLRSPIQNTDKKDDTQQIDESVDMRTYDISRLMEEFPKLEQLEFKKFKKYQPFFDYIRLDYWRMILSQEYQKNWKLKSMALDQITNLPVTQGKHLIAMMEVVAITIIDKHTVNVKKSLLLLEKLINLQNKDLWCDPNYPRYFIDIILSTLIQLMTDTKQQFRKLSIEIYKNLPQFSLVYLQTSIRTLIKTSSSSSTTNKNKRKSNPKLQLSKLTIIQYYLSTFTDVIHHLNQIIKWLTQCANDASADVRMVSMQMLLEIGRMDRQLYNKIKQQLIKRDKNVLQGFQLQYNVMINQIQNSKMVQKSNNQHDDSVDFHKKETIRSKNRNSSRVVNQSSLASVQRSSNKDEEVELAYSQQSIPQSQRSHDWFTNPSNISRNQPQNNASSYQSPPTYQSRSADPNQIRVMQPYQDQLQGLCDYCYRKYQDQDLNYHLLNTCPAVITCQYCNGAIYLRQYNEHLLSACKKKHQQCPRCMMAYQFEQINQHVARNMCKKAKNTMERCPFCQEDVQPDDILWAEHAEKCDKIVRPKRNIGGVYTENSQHMETDR